MQVSVIMPAYNCGDYIEQSIQSVLAQTMTDWEIQLVDDGSTDHTQQVLRPYLEHYPNIHYHRLPQNYGPAAARTEAIKDAVGRYVAFLDSDDVWLPTKLEKQIQFMERTGAKFSCTAYAIMDVAGNSLHTAMVPPARMDYTKCIRLSDPIGNLTAMYDQQALGKFVVPQIQRRNDFALWLQILKKTEFCYGLDEVLGVYRRGRKGSVSSGKMKLAKYHWQLYHEIEQHSITRSLYELGCWAFVKGTGIGLVRKKF